MDGNGASLTRQMFPVLVSYTLIVIMEAYVFGSQELKASDLKAILLSQIYVVLTVFLLWICVINHHTLPFLHLLLSSLVALLFRL